MTKKSILIAIHYMELGGAEMSLLGLLESLDYSQYDVDLFVHSHQGELIGYIPKQVTLLPEIAEYAQIERPIKDVVKAGYYRIALSRLRGRREFFHYSHKKHPIDGSAIFSYVSRRVAPLMPCINPAKEYDVAVSYLTPHDYVLSRVKAKEKVAWIHTDYSRIDVNADLELPVWSGYDKIVSISEDVTRNFLKVFPSLADRIIERPNLVPEGYVKAKAEDIPQEQIVAEMPKPAGRMNLLSVGRFSYPKNYDNVPDICRRIRGKGVDAKWYLIGFGGEEDLIKRKIEEAGMREYVVILGKRDNPYPYMKACDVYVQPSRYEGDPMTVHEATALGKPVVLTSFPTVDSVKKRIPGCTVVPVDNEGCAAAIAAFVQDIRNDS